MPDHCRGEHKTPERRKKRLTALETGAECCWSRLRGLANRAGQDGFAFDRDLVIGRKDRVRFKVEETNARLVR